MHASKAKRWIYSPLYIGSEAWHKIFSQFLESRAPEHIIVVWEDKHNDHEHLPCPNPFPELLLLSTMSYNMEYLFGSALMAVCPLLTSSPAWMYSLGARKGTEREKIEKAVTLCKYCSAIARTCVIYQQCFSTLRTPMKKVNSIPARPSTGQEIFDFKWAS